MALIEEYEVGDLHVEIHAFTSDFAQHPGVRIQTPTNHRVLGGGALVNWHGAGNLLTSIYPDGDRVWVATSKDHRIVSPATVTGYCICARMRDGSMISRDDYIIVGENSVPAQHPSTEVVLPDGFILVGGGARANWTGVGSLLYASHPGGGNSWVASAKDHIQREVTTVTAFAIGLKQSFLQRSGLEVRQTESTSETETAHPSVQAALPQGFRLFCGGARANWNGEGSLLTASFPIDRHIWEARSKDHEKRDPSTVTAWAIGVSIG
jgi:hypothetical protein